ncbi:putative pyrophosphatase/phosphodiesterase [Candida tropicalis]
MSHPQPHAVDVPITDMDDPEDDIIFAEQAHDNTHTRPSTFLDTLDYENTASSQQGQNGPGIFSKFKSFLTNSQPSSASDYEMVSRFDIDTPSETDGEYDESREPPLDIRDYRIKLLEKQVKNRTIIGSVVLFTVGILTFILFFNRNNGHLGIQSSGGNTRRIYTNSTHNFHQTTILISLDGFHPHYINPLDTPTMHNIMKNDYGAPYMIPSFPSSTFPNHWTLITGLYPSEHGIVGNTFYDPLLKKQFINTNPKIGGLDPDFWQGGEPIWKTAKKQNIKTAVHMWPGSEVPHIGPEDDFDRYNGSELLSSKVDRVMGWLDRDSIDNRPELILTYVPTIDQFGHKFGISGQNLTDALTYVDNFLDLLKQELHKRNLDDIVNVIIVSDHGMAPTSNDRLLYLDDLIDLDKIEHIDGWPLFGLRPKEEFSVDEIYNELQEKFNKMGSEITSNYEIYKVEDVPKEFQFGGNLTDHKFNYRLAPIWIFPNVGYSITTHQQMKDNNFDYKPKGVHGYNNTHLLMRAIFLGFGPYFKNKPLKVEPFQNTQVYNLVCDTLDIIPAPNNGTQIHEIWANELDDGWLDSLSFPNLPFEIEHIVRNNATYDSLWRKGKYQEAEEEGGEKEIPTNDHPLEDMRSEESTITSLTPEKLPKPTDFISTETGNTLTTSTTSKIHQGFGDIMGDIMDGIGDGVEAIGDAFHNLIDDIF